MTDRELLEKAAKAAGYWCAEFNCPASLPSPAWNPLTDDGDALRLAVKLGLKVMPYPIYGADKHSVIVSKRVHATDPEAEVPYIGPECIELYEADSCAATRRAIVRAAAAMGSA